MKKITRLYKPYMMKPIIYKSITKTSIALAAVLLWNEWINKEGFKSLGNGFLTVGLMVMLLSWFSYLKLDGIRLPQQPEKQEKKKKHRMYDIIDFADEKVISFDDLERDEQEICNLSSSLITGVLFLVVSLVYRIFKI